ncbi:MAG: D-cysteine desulfhydrase family protein [Anaerolineaceae bacterium]|nr:D-cysteine desulfhydrase family protein [Anaerolineaceae bacterium]
MKVPRVRIAHLPTRIEFLERLSAALQGPQIFCKRDDQTGLGFGGNKTRKLEFLLAEAQQAGARTLLSVGAIQSNHCRQVAAMAARYGFDCILVLSGSEPEIASGNLFLDQLFGAKIVWANRENRNQVLDQVFQDAQLQGKKPYKIPYGGSSATGMMGYVEAINELKSQESDFDWIITASSSGGTQSGMLLGAEISGFQGKILGISIEDHAAQLRESVSRLIQEGSALLGLKIDLPLDKILVNDDYLGGGYGVMGPAEVEAIQMFASLEGLLLDPVYTGRAAAGMIDLIRKGFFDQKEKVLFWHTGGTPALFAEPYLSMLQKS